MFVMTKGSDHNAYDIGSYDHIEPVWGIYSNQVMDETKPVNETNVFGDDWLVHGSDYQPDGDANVGYFREILKMPDFLNMSTNCRDA